MSESSWRIPRKCPKAQQITLQHNRISSAMLDNSSPCSVSTGITWVLVYRTDKYKRLKAEVEKQSKKRKSYERSIFMY